MGSLPAHRHRESFVRLVASRGRRILLAAPPTVATADHLLDPARHLRLGAAVTLLAPIVGAVRSAGARGVHLAPTAADVGLTADGRPVLLLTTPAVGSAGEARTALRGLVARVGEHCSELPVALLTEQRDSLALEGRLYGLAEPEGLGAAVREIEGPKRPRAGVRTVADPAPQQARHRRAHPFDDGIARLGAILRRRRGPVAAGSAIVIGAVLAGAMGTPPSGGANGRDPVPTVPSTVGVAAAHPARPASTPAAPTGGAPSAPGVGAGHGPSSDLPAEEAASLLVTAAMSCSDILCAQALTLDDSPLHGSREGLATALPVGASVSEVLVQGASAVVDLGTSPETTAASVLMIRTEAGWLIRDVYVGETP
ncbi:hypothetical protein [Rathayibacter tanaceti]|uniref:Uncharacterized protein n=2 Tax=Rathayibacter tanaceti TaxID=1671680 RepID=A0A166D669_9MICO|nr:hypothetical protein [Rathayibacter tanaceti]KZX21887.1 hypothetical protein ACH61_00993 [Rathayibacter tanaceti]QHC55538.1 hypothetical protein GSU10_07710 [Rathayibacter tanaceti]TCO39683.1 hypothetical protein EV639_101639 [Rathayibacter tanaceti]